MDLIRYSISKPVSVAVGVIIIVLFGFIGLSKLPVQLTPDVETPQITVKTNWSGATPYEIEKDIIEKQEEVLKGIKNLTLMESSSYNNYGEITLSFKVGTDLDNALLRVSNKLDEVEDYPENVDKPIIDAAGAQSSPVIWMTMKTRPENTRPIKEFRTFFENEVRQHLERVDGVASLLVVGGTEDQLQITIDPLKLARYDLTISEVISRVQQANRDVSAGILGMGKKDYRIRTAGKFENTTDPLDVVIYDDGIKRVLLRDIGTVAIGYEKESTAVMQNGRNVIVAGVRKEKGANVITLTEEMKGAIKKLNDGLLGDQGLYFEIVHEQTQYINTSIAIVKQNIAIGGLLAIAVLILFLRSFSSTVTTAIAIPISVIGTFIFLWVLDRNLNVVSLAGISFAVGMLVDNAIVVLENIDRHRNMGKPPYQASYDGAREVWGAVLASTVTTVAVFLPVIFIEEEAGQLFQDIAIAITFSIIISLFVSISVIPATTNQLFRLSKGGKKNGGAVVRIGAFFAGVLLRISGFFLKNFLTRAVCVVLFTAISVSLVIVLIPKAEYLPQGNRNLILNILIPPPGLSTEKRKEVGQFISDSVAPYIKDDYVDGIPQIRNLFYVAAEGFNLFGAVSTHETEARQMMPLLTRIIHALPGYFGVSMQAGIFQNRIGRGRTIDV
ncbi:MAG: efflux RND transporter permease subunit, partial [Desulfobulbaceae bacterium]|nr:efflux RND transporter permease subunit [Desulfobulbaceae bacterium]